MRSAAIAPTEDEHGPGGLRHSVDKEPEATALGGRHGGSQAPSWSSITQGDDAGNLKELHTAAKEAFEVTTWQRPLAAAPCLGLSPQSALKCTPDAAWVHASYEGNYCLQLCRGSCPGTCLARHRPHGRPCTGETTAVALRADPPAPTSEDGEAAASGAAWLPPPVPLPAEPQAASPPPPLCCALACRE